MTCLRVLFFLLALGLPFSSYSLTNRLFDISQMTLYTQNSLTNFLTNCTAEEGAVFGISTLYTATSLCLVSNAGPARVTFTITNNGNYPEESLILSVTAPGLTNPTPWSYYLEVNSVNVGTNYGVPSALFGAKAVLQFSVVITAAPAIDLLSTLDLNISAEISNNSNHNVALYTGFNGMTYGGYSNITGNLGALAAGTGLINGVAASDGVETLTALNGQGTLRRTKNTIHLRLTAIPLNPDQITMYYATSGIADGPSGSNQNQVPVTMTRSSTLSYSASIPENSLNTGNQVSFLFVIDGTVFDNSYIYNLGSLSAQGTNRTILINNWIVVDSGEITSLKLPEDAVGKQAKILIVSISGDIVKVILNGTANEQVYSWDGKENDGKYSARGLYYLIAEFNGTREIRSVFVR